MIENIKDYVFDILDESRNRINNEFTSSKNVYSILMIASALFCVIISFFINMIGIWIFQYIYIIN